MKSIEWKQEWPYILFAFLLPLIFFWNVFTNHSFGLDCAPSVMGNHEPYAQEWVGGNPFCSTSPDPGAYVWQHPPHWLEAMRSYTSGTFPMWTQNIGTGIPLSANFISTALFVPMLPFIWLFKISANNVLYLDVFFLFRYMMMAGGMYLFLRTLGVSRIIGFIGGIAIFSTGFYITMPNIGHHNVDMLFPLFLFCLNMLYISRNIKWVGWASLSLGISMLGAMPEISALLLFFTGCYVLLLSFVIAKKADIPFFIWTTISVVTGIAMGSILIVPGLEYVFNANSTHHVGELVPKSIPFLNIINFVFPEIYINPSVKQQLLDSGKITFHLEVWNYVGTILTFLFITAIIYCGSRLKEIRTNNTIQLLSFFILFCVVMVVQQYNILHTIIFEHLPVFKETYYPKYSSTLINFTLITASCIALFEILKKRTFTVVVSWLLFMLICAAVTVYARGVYVDLPEYLKFNLTNRNVLHGVFFATMLTVFFMLIRWRSIIPYIICVCLLFEFFNYLPKGGYQGRYDTLRKPPAVSFLQSKNDGGHRIFAVENILYPNNATIFDLNDMRMLDALWVRRYFEYTKAFFAEPYVQRITGLKEVGATEPANILTNPYFNALSVKYIFSYSPLESLVFDKTSLINSVIKVNPGLPLKNDMVLAGEDTKSALIMTQPTTVQFELTKPVNSEFLILNTTNLGSEATTLKARILSDNQLLSEKVISSTGSADLKNWSYIQIGPIPQSVTGKVTLELSSALNPASPPVAWSGFYWDSDARMFDNAYNLIYNEEMRIYQNMNAQSRVRFVNNIKCVQPISKNNYEPVIEAVRKLQGSIATTAIVETTQCPGEVFDSSSARITNQNFQDMNISFTYSAPTPQYVVVADTYYPGWNVYIDGKKLSIDAADLALRGIALPAANNAIVELRYEPMSFYIGGAISLVSTILAFIFLIMRKKIDESLLSLTLHKHSRESTLR